MKEQDKISLNDRIVNFVSNNIVWVFLGFIVIVIILPRLFIGTSKIGFLDNLKPNEIGDAIGGMTAPIIGLFSAFLVYIAFREQKKANEIQLKQIKDQELNVIIEKETNYYSDKIIRIEKMILEFRFNIDGRHDFEITGVNAIRHMFMYSKNGIIKVPHSYHEFYYIINSISDLIIKIEKSNLNQNLNDIYLNEMFSIYKNLIKPNIRNNNDISNDFIVKILDCINNIENKMNY